MPSTARTPARGRPVATSHAEIERVAFGLFEKHGFAGTTLEDIAAAVGVGRRTLFRYFGSKNDIPWGQFDQTLDGFRRIFAAMPGELPLHAAVHRAVVEFNDFPDSAQGRHRERMRLILTTPELQAHSVLRYAEWRQVIAEYVAERLGASATDLLPRVTGHVSLGLALSAYEVWLADEDAVLTDVVDRAMLALKDYLGGRPEAQISR